MFDEDRRSDWSIQDPAAAAELRTLLQAAARDLAALGRQPAIVAACPTKHDDTGRYPSWLGLQLGNAWWERAEYRIFADSDHVDEDGQNQSTAQTLRPILDPLQSASWRSLVEHAFGFKLLSESLVVAVQHDAAWFLISASNEGEDAAFIIQPAGDLLYVGAAERFDHCLGKAYSLILEHIDDAAWPLLRKAAPLFPLTAPLIAVHGDATIAAHNTLVSLLHTAIEELSSVPGELKYLEGANRDPDYPVPRQPWRALALDEVHAAQQGWSVPDRFQESMRANGGGVAAIHEILERLELAGWRDLFSKAITPLADDESLALLQRDGGTWLVARRTTLFQLNGAGLRVAGACDYLSGAGFADRVPLHMF